MFTFFAFWCVLCVMEKSKFKNEDIAQKIEIIQAIVFSDHPL
jgi:hypothetical protein